MKTDHNVNPVPRKDIEALDNEKKKLLWSDYKADFLAWLWTMGKDPEHIQGYAQDTVQNTSYRVSRFYRWLWAREDGYTTNATHEDADEFMLELAFDDQSQSYRAKHEKALKRYFAYRADQRGGEKWEPERHVSEPQHSRPADYLSREERAKIREAVLDYDAVPSYSDLDPEERDRWKTYLAQFLGKSKEEVTPDDWNSEYVNSWKFTSLVWVSLDVGLRPVEVKRSRMSWFDLENQKLFIPKEESSKSRENWECALSDQTVTALNEWFDERENYEKYDGRDEVWLTREGNPYQSQSLRLLLHSLCKEAGISTENRKMSWYAIRHSVGTFMHDSKGLAAAQKQLRHRSPQTTMKYVHPDLDTLRDGLNEMG